ncbi:MAG: GGDEF domain-containing protein [Desulfuromonadaceae bacterium]
MAVKTFLNKNDKLTLPTPPSVATLILEELGREDVDFDRLSRIITADSALTARILKVANSPLFSPAGNIDCIHVALTRLGTTQVTNIALSFILVHAFNKRRVDSAFDFNFFWRHALTSAVAANLLHKELFNENGNTFITGLLHDVGILIAGSQMPEYCEMFDNSAPPLVELRKKEQQAFGFSHCQLGAEVLKKWQIPESITQPILFHHNPEEAPPEYRDAAFVIQVADLIADMFHGRPSSDKFGVLEKLLKQKSIDQATIDRLVQEIFTNSLKTLAFFEIPPDKIKSPAQLLQEANTILGQLNLNTDVELQDMKRERDTLVNNSKQLYRVNSELSRLAFEDSLTGLHNMRYFNDYFQREIQRSLRYKTCFSLILLDLDNFKEVNDTYGHPAGDRVLQYIAELIYGTLRQVDLAARYGGEEFAVFLPETNRNEAMIIAERLRHQIEVHKTPWQKHKIRVTASIGVTHFCPETEEANQDEIIARADRAMYVAKESGKNSVQLADTDTQAH